MTGTSLRHRPLHVFLHYVRFSIALYRTVTFLKKLAVLCLIIGIFLCWMMVRWPVPDDMVDPWQARAVSLTFLLATWTADIGSILGLGSWFAIFRFSTDTALSSFSFQDENITETRKKFGGVPVVLYDPVTREKNSPAVVYFHGGGWTFFSADAYRHVTQTMARDTTFLVVSVDYRLAPENVYPIPLQDSLIATKYFIDNAATYGVDSNRIAVAGDDAGGNIAAAVALALLGYKNQSKDVILPKAQVLIYPPLQFINMNLPSYQQLNGTSVVLNTENLVYLSQIYAFGNWDENRLGFMLKSKHVSTKYLKRHLSKLDSEIISTTSAQNETEENDGIENDSTHPELESIVLDPYFSPLMADKVSGLPATLIITCEYDIVRDDGHLFANRLNNSNVHVEHINYKGSWHGAMTFASSLPFSKDISDFLKRNL